MSKRASRKNIVAARNPSTMTFFELTEKQQQYVIENRDNGLADIISDAFDEYISEEWDTRTAMHAAKYLDPVGIDYNLDNLTWEHGVRYPYATWEVCDVLDSTDGVVQDVAYRILWGDAPDSVRYWAEVELRILSTNKYLDELVACNYQDLLMAYSELTKCSGWEDASAFAKEVMKIVESAEQFFRSVEGVMYDIDSLSADDDWVYYYLENNDQYTFTVDGDTATLCR